MADKPITVKAYGRIHTFPAGTPTEQIEATLAEHEHVLNPDYEQPSGASGLLGSVVRGAKGTGRLVSAGYDAFTGDRSGVDKTAATSNLAAERETPIEQGRLQFELNGIDREQGVMGQIGYTLKTAGRNPMGTAQLVAEQLPNSAVTLAGGYAGFKGGALAGAPFGPAGAAIGGAIGFLGGMFLGNTLIEAGSKGIQKASDKDGFTEQDKDDTIRESAIKGAVLTGVDAATLKLGSAIMKRLGSTAVREGAKAEAKVLMDAGVDMSSTTTINAALKSSPELFQAARLAGEKAAVGALSRSKKAGIVGTGLTMETAGEGVGEYAGEYAATGKADVVDATIEALSGATMSAAETAYNFNKLKAGNDLSAKGMMDSITPETLEGKRNDAMQKADVINKQQQQQDMADIGAATDIDQAIAATVSAVSRPAANANDILRAEDPTLADIERLTGLKPTHAIDAAIDEINNPIIDQPLEAENGNNQTSQQEATTKTPVLATNESIEKSTNGQAPAGTGGPERAGASRVVESPVPEVEDQGASAEALGPAEPVSAQKTNSDGSVWEVKYRTIKRSDGMVMVVREREGLNGAVTEHLNSNFDWVKGEPSAAVLNTNKGRIIDGPELFTSRDKAIENAMEVDETTITSTPTPAKQTKPPLGTDKLTDTSPVLSAEMFKASGKTGTSYAQYLKEHPNRKEAASVDLKNVEDTLVKSLQKTGKFTATDSKTYAKKFTEFYKVNAERQGILPSELYERMPLKFNGTKSQRLSQDAKVTPASRNKQNFDLKDATPEDFTPDNVGSLINRKNWAIMTAANPQGKSQDDAKNLEANKKLQKELADKGLAFEVVKGMYPGDKSEMESYLVYGIDQKAANELGNKYGQDSVLTREGLVHQSGKVTPVKAVGKGTPDGYTKVPRTGARFAFDMDWDREASVGDGALSVVARHYSKAPRKALEGSRFGEGYKGEERERIAESDDPRLKSRVDFYVDTGEGVTPETGLGEHIHEKLLHNIYDASTNPKRFKFPSNWLGANTFEKQVLDAGYDGYFTRQGKQGRVVVLGDAAKSIPIEDNNEQSGESELLSQSEGTDTSSRESDGSLQGLPRQVGQFNAALHKKAEKVARDYMKSAGLEYNPPNTYANVNVERAERIATAFDAMKHDPQNPEVKAAYAALVKETTAQYKAVVDSGLKVEFIDFAKTGDPYAGNPRAMTEDVRKNNHMWVFSTRDGFGSSDFDPADNPLLAETEFEISGQKALANDLFRVVHDYFGHVKEGVGFRAAGEENAWRAHMAMFSPEAGRALTTETRGQNSWVNYGPFAEFNKTASGADTKYADQKIGLLPEWVSNEGAGDEEYNQSVKLSTAKETLKKYGLKPDGRYSTRQVAAALEARQRAKFGSIAAGDYSKESLDKIASWMAEEVAFEMQNPKDSGAGWYSERFQRALDVMGEKYPELKTDKNARNTFTALLAITSDGQKVGANLSLADDIYGRYKDTGKFTIRANAAQRNSFQGNLDALQDIVDKMGVEKAHEFLLSEKTLSELKKLAAEHGKTLNSPYQADFKLPMAALAFGPKLGAFYANLMGSHGYITMDRWWSRTFNRYRGTLLQSPTGSGLSTFRGLIGQEGLSDDEAVAASVAPRGAYEARGFKTRLAELVGSSEPATDKAKVNWMETAKAKAGVNFPELLKEHNIERAANTIYKKAFVNLEDAPFGARDRTFMTDATRAAQKKLAKKGLHPSIADIQAILWYYEKKLYGKMGAKQSGVISYEDAARRLVSGKADGPDLEGGTGAAVTELGDEEVSIGDEDFGESYAQSNFYSALEKEIVVDGVKRPTTNSEGKPISNPINFWKWFRDSEARQWPESSRGDRKMAPPLVFYHGTKGDFNEFVVGSPGTNSTVFGPWETHRAGMFFTQDKKFAESFSTQGDSKQGANVMPVYLKVENAIDLTDGFTDDAVIDALAEKGVNPRLMRNISADQIWGMFDKEDDGDFFVSKLKELGYDGAIIVEPNQATDESVESWVAFNPNQIKSAIGNNGEFDRNDPNILKQSNFYSALEKEIVNLKKIANKNGEVSVEQAKAWINSRQKEGKFKQAEVEAVGLNDWLDTLEGKVPVTDVEEFVQENGVQVEEVVLAGEGTSDIDEDAINDEAYQDFIENYNGPSDGVFDEAIGDVAGDMMSDHNDGRWGDLIGLNDEEEVETWLKDEGIRSRSDLVYFFKSRYGPEDVLGNDGYNEVRDAQEQDDWERNQDYYLDRARERAEEESGGGSGGTEFGAYVLRGGAEYKELLLTLPNSKAKFNAPHFDKAQDDGAENIFAHTRINERFVDRPPTEEQLAEKAEYEAEVARLNKLAEPLFAEKKRSATEYDALLRELAKDRKVTEVLGNPPKELTALTAANEQATEAVRALSKELPEKPYWMMWGGEKERVLFVEEIQSDWAQKGRDEGFASLTPEERNELALLDERARDLGNTRSKLLLEGDEAQEQRVAINLELLETNKRREEIRGKVRGRVPTAPFVTDTKAWTGLVAKRLLRYAAENGFDRIAWTAGAQQAERYRLSKFVDKVTAKRSDDGKYYVKAVTEDGKPVAADFYEADKLAGTFGKELADKIISQPEGEQNYTGLDLDVGGSGMKEFYDRIVPSVFNDISRKLGGEKVETISMGGQSGKVVTGLEGRIVITYPNGSYLKNRNTGVMTESQDRADRFDSKEEATKFLDKFESQNLHDVGRQMSLAITPALREKVMQGLPLFQRDRAGYNPNTFTISLMEGSDMTSVIHEGGHFYLEALADMASRPDAPEQIVKDFDTTLDWFGVTKEDWKTMTLEQKRPHHEQWAQSFERYAMEGVSPTEEMQPVFERFKEWMLETYKSLKEFLKNNPLAGRLNNDVRQVFDRLLASENDIAATAAARGSLKQSGKQTPLRIYDKSLSQFAAAVARRLGAKPSGRSKGSRYYTLPDGSELRISDHEFPRGHGGGVAEVDIIYNKEDYGVDVFRNDVKTGIKTKEVSYRSLNLNGSDMGGLEGFNGDTQAWGEAVSRAIEDAAGAPMLSQSPKQVADAPAPAKPFNPNEDIPETRFRKVQRLSQDSFNRFTVIKEWLAEHGTVLSEKADVFQAEERYNSLVANQLEDFREQQRNPLIEKITKAGFTLSDVADFLEAQHAREANKAIQDVRSDPTATAYGITDADAKAYLAKADPKLKKLANELRDITEKSKQMRLAAGLLSQDEVDAWDNAYKFYIPVKGDADAKGGTGKGLKVNFKSKRRLGHGKRDEAVIENIFLDHEKAIMQVEKNRVAKHLVMMAAEMNRPEIVSVGQPVKRNVLRNKVAYEVQVNGVTRSTFTTKQAADMFKQLLPTIDKSVRAGSVTVNKTTDQRVIGMASPMLAENEINAYIDGHAIRVQINDDLLARAYGKLGVTGFSALVSAGRAFNGYLSKVYTGYNPEFILTNMIRDFTSGLINLTGEEGGKIAAKAAANYVESFSSLMKYAISNGKKSDKWIDMYRANGGNTGAAYLSDLERLGDEIKTEYASYQGVLANLKSGDIANASRAAGRKVFNITLKWIYNLNQAGENAMRLAAFRAMIESGKTPNQAAKASKNITVNFNRKGELGAEANAAYLFFNASVQGTAALAHAHFKGKHKAQAWGLSSMVGVLGYLAAMALIGDDEDDYDKINDYTKSRNLLIKAGEGYVQIPVPYGYGFFWNTGRAIAEAQHKGELGVLPWHIAASAIEELTPFSDTVVGSQAGFHFDQVLLGMLPTVIKIPAQPAFNKQLFSGGELFPERASQQFQPDREKLWRSTQGTMYDRMAGWLSDANVGDVTPETLKHYTRTFTGGTGALVDATISAAMLKKEGAELEPSEIPFVRKAYSKLTIRENRAAYYKAREEAKKTAEAFSRAKTRNDVTTIDKLVKDEGEMLGLDAYANSLSEAIGAVRDLQDAIRVDDSLNAAEKRVQIKELEITEQKFYDQYLDVFKIEKMKMKSRKD